MSGAYIYLQDDKPYLFIYKREYTNNLNIFKNIYNYFTNYDNCITGVFDIDGRDYIGRINMDKIIEMLNSVENYAIIDIDYENIPLKFKKYIDKELYDNWNSFAVEQLDNL